MQRLCSVMGSWNWDANGCIPLPVISPAGDNWLMVLGLYNDRLDTLFFIFLSFTVINYLWLYKYKMCKFKTFSFGDKFV